MKENIFTPIIRNIIIPGCIKEYCKTDMSEGFSLGELVTGVSNSEISA